MAHRTPKEKVLAAIHGERTPTVPAGLHGWGMYEFAQAGRLSDYSIEKQKWRIHGQELAQIEVDFQETFRPDFMQLAEAFFESKKEIINSTRHSALLKAVRKLQTRSVIDEFLDLMYDESDELFERKFAHLRELSERYGEQAFVILTTEGPVHDLIDSDGILGFEEGLIAFLEHPNMFRYILEGISGASYDTLRRRRSTGPTPIPNHSRTFPRTWSLRTCTKRPFFRSSAPSTGR